jgi:hypothetical protein
MGWRAMKSARAFSTSPMASPWARTRACQEGLSTVPGQIAVARMPRVTKSAAIPLVMPITAALVAP